MPEKPQIINQSRILLVEGDDERHLVKGLQSLHGFPDFQIIDYKGKDKFRSFLGTLRLTEGFNQVTSIGILRDADSNPSGAFQSIQDSLNYNKLPCPGKPVEAARADNLSVRVFIIPGAGQQGMLETLCLQALADDPVFACVNEFSTCVQSKRTQNFNMAKVQMQAFLASFPGVRLIGEAALAGHLNLGNAAYQPLVNFLKQVTV